VRYTGPNWRVVVVFLVSVGMVVWLIGNRLPEIPGVNW
jgi:hypothetical protein